MANKQLSKHFKASEFACRCCGVSKADPKLIVALEDLREHYKSPVTINSGYRCLPHNRNIGSTDTSPHPKGIAADIKVLHVAPSRVHDYLIKKYPSKYGIGKYNTFTHIDVRPGPARWTG